MGRTSGWLDRSALPYSDRETSLAAARDARSGAEAARTAVLAFIRRRGAEGATDAEVEEALGLIHQTASARRRELVLAGLVAPNGRRRPTSTGAPAKVWVAVDRSAEPLQWRLL